jgi:hypothetical protein
MKIYFPNCGSDAGNSIRAVINALLKRLKVERAQTAHARKNVSQIGSEWDYRPKRANRRYAAFDVARAETAETVSSTASAADTNNMIWFDFIGSDPAVEDG